MRHLPGFISANIHASLDGTRVANYAQWRSVEDFQTMLQDPAAGQHFEAINGLATAEPHLYRVASVNHIQAHPRGRPRHRTGNTLTWLE